MQRKMLIIRAMILILTVLGMIMLISGITLRVLSAQRHSTDTAQMPEEYIEEFFSGENSEPKIENYIEPEFN